MPPATAARLPRRLLNTPLFMVRPLRPIRPTAVLRRVEGRDRARIVELSTLDFLRLLEAQRRIQSADAVMDLFDLSKLEICPWALREGIILERLDQIGVRG